MNGSKYRGNGGPADDMYWGEDGGRKERRKKKREKRKKKEKKIKKEEKQRKIVESTRDGGAKTNYTIHGTYTENYISKG